MCAVIGALIRSAVAVRLLCNLLLKTHCIQIRMRRLWQNTICCSETPPFHWQWCNKKEGDCEGLVLNVIRTNNMSKMTKKKSFEGSLWRMWESFRLTVWVLLHSIGETNCLVIKMMLRCDEECSCLSLLLSLLLNLSLSRSLVCLFPYGFWGTVDVEG